MKVAVRLTKEEISPCIVMLASLCVNNDDHFDIFIEGEEIDEDDIEKIRANLSHHRVLVGLSDGFQEDVIALPVDIIIDGDMTDIFRKLNEDENGTIYDYSLNAPVAHDTGMSYDDVKGKYQIISFPEDKPWLCTNIHYDIERIWWEYAKNTDVYHDLMEQFLESALSDTFLEDYAIRICDQNDELREAIKQIEKTVGKISN